MVVKVLLVLAALATVVRFGCAPSESVDVQPIQFQDGFEQGLLNWTIDKDLPKDPNTGQPVAAEIAASDEQAFQGNMSARLYLDGRQDDGTIWLQRKFNVVRRHRYDVHLSFAFWSESESFNLISRVAAYAGANRPRREEDFDLSQAANLAAGWRQYSYTFPVTSDGNGEIWTAMGMSAVWETEMTYYIDDVRVQILPR
jgi:hypothetical protein